MRTIFPAAIAALLLLSGAAQADHKMAKAPFAYATAASARAGGAYVSVMNHGPADRLIGARSDAAKRVEIHENVMTGGVMKMRKVDAIVLPEDGVIEMKPGGYHIMFMGLTQPFEAGATVPVTLIFESGAELVVETPVIERGESAPAGDSDHSGHGSHSD